MSFFGAAARATCVVLAMAAAAVLTGCEEEIADGLSTDLPFTLYGYLDPTADTQYVRVFPIRPTNLAPEAPEPIDASVTFRDLQSGEIYTARDSLVEFASGRYGHVFWSPFAPDFSRQYTIEIERSDGAEATATTRTPGELQAQRTAPYTEFSLAAQGYVPYLPLDLSGTDMRLLRLVARYEVELFNVGRQVIDIPYLGAVQSSADGWHVEFNLVDDFDHIFEELRNLRELYGEEMVGFVSLDIVPEIANPEWTPPGGVFDADLLVEPGTFDNVENGFGFFGSAYRQVHRYPIAPCLRLIAGFTESPLACGPEERCEYLEQCE